ncbi:LuxR C-terminal-related transcriptional regulator [Actibacterium sp.]|uniref:LuxR C-terminal-related transcriptional regulator n=1 Tax=Actibacterium sp. TaxID=1872125 RepID=UPI0035662D40
MTAVHKLHEAPRLALVIDDHPLFCDALAMTLKAVAGIGMVESYNCLQSALARLMRPPLPDILVLDLNLPDVTGLDGLLRLRKAAPGRPVVVVSSITDTRTIASVIRSGAAGFVPKHSKRDTFRAAFDTIAEGRTFIPEGMEHEDLRESDLHSPREEALQRLGQLTRQQARILDLICEGKLNKQIAYDLSIAETTVKAHVTAILRKLGVQSRTQAVLLVQEASFRNLIDDAG